MLLNIYILFFSYGGNQEKCKYEMKNKILAQELKDMCAILKCHNQV